MSAPKVNPGCLPPEQAVANARAGLGSPRAGFNSIFRPYKLLDWLTQGYIVLIGLSILCLHGQAVPLWGLLVAAHFCLVLLIHALLRLQAAVPGSRILEILRHFYPILLFTFFYRETGLLNHMLIPGYLDPFFIRLEQSLFGCQPSLELMEQLPFLPVSELFYAAYFSYYIMIAGVGVALFIQQREQFLHYVSVISFVMFACYLVFVFTPVAGPPIFYPELGAARLPPEMQPAVVPPVPAAIQAGPFYQIMTWIYQYEASGAAFPSSHVAVAIATLYFSFLYLRRIRYLHLAMVILLALATVYCRYHYAVDVLGGALTAAVLLPLANCLYSKFAKTTEIDRSVAVPSSRST